MNEEMINYLKENRGGVSYGELAEKFLKIKNNSNVAKITVNSILSKDKRCYIDNNGLWHINIETGDQSVMLCNLPLTAVYILSDSQRKDKRIFHVSLWSINPEISLISEKWLTNPVELPFEEREALGAESGIYFEPEQLPQTVASIALELEGKLPVFFSYYDYLLFNALFEQHGFYLSEDILLASDLMKPAEVNIPRPFTFDRCLKEVIGNDQIPSNILKRGKQFAECIAELIQLLKMRGIESRTGLEKARPEQEQFFKGKDFTSEDINNMPVTPGVYGFKEKDGSFIYIGKAKNLRRRLQSYFRETEESPQKIRILREKSQSLVAYQCGSELESLIYEYRLIKKHAPQLNRQLDINERPGNFRPIQDCIILLPHVQKDKIMSFWFRRDQKIMMKPVDFDSKEERGLLAELKDFFLSEKLSATNEDFPEQEIAFRWIRSHELSIMTVPVSRLASETEIFEALSCSIEELRQES
jgi:hypothetical protein